MSRVYAAKNRDSDVRATSASGGVFRALCAHVIDIGGVVYGARYDSEMRVVHGRATTLEACKPFSGSKYIQSDMAPCYRQVQSDLQAGRVALFSGTPCQVRGIQLFLESVGCDGHLLTVDLLCHGIVSPGLWSEHVALTEQSAQSKLREYSFRDKRFHWRQGRRLARTDRGIVRGHLPSAFGEVFDWGYALRPSCHACPFARLDRGGDITLGDYWGAEKHHPEIDDGAGLSLVFVNTVPGEALWAQVRNGLDLTSLRLDECMQPILRGPTPPSPRRDSFWAVYRKTGYESAIRRYTSYGTGRRLLRSARRALKGLLR